MNSFFLPLFKKSSEVCQTKYGPRKTFFYKSNKVFACGLLVSYMNTKGQTKKLLMKTTQNGRTIFSVLGGKVDMQDACPFDTLTKQLWEQTSTRLFGNKTNLDEFKELLKTFLTNSGCKIMYVSDSKNLVLSVRCNNRLPGDCCGLVKAPLNRFIKKKDSLNHNFVWVRPHEMKGITMQKLARY